MSTPASELDFEETMVAGGSLKCGDYITTSRADYPFLLIYEEVEWASADTAIARIVGIKDPMSCASMVAWKQQGWSQRHELVGRKIRYVW